MDMQRTIATIEVEELGRQFQFLRPVGANLGIHYPASVRPNPVRLRSFDDSLRKQF